MKTTAFITLLFCVTNLFAQTNYYAENKEFNESGYTYVCELTRSGDVVLRNKEYKLTEDDLKSTPEIRMNVSGQVNLSKYIFHLSNNILLNN